jgi:hypothetical protein
MGANVADFITNPDFLNILTGGAGIYSKISTASAAKDAYDANAAVADMQAEQVLKTAKVNAATAETQARDAVVRGGETETGMRRQFAVLRGRQRAQAAAMGIDVDSGSPAHAREVSRGEEERDVAVNALNHAREAWGYKVAAANHLAEGEAGAAAMRYQGTLARIQGKSALTTGHMSGFADLLSLVPANIGQAAGGGTLYVPGSNPAPYVPPDSVVSDDATARAMRFARKTPLSKV